MTVQNVSQLEQEKQKTAMKEIKMDKFEGKKKIKEDNIVKAKMSNNKSKLVENRETEDQIKQKAVAAENYESLSTLTATTESTIVTKKMEPELEKTIEKPAIATELVTLKMKDTPKNDMEKVIDKKKNEIKSDEKEIKKEMTQK
ncbi:hypothetical protein QQG55_18755 [Brugia pahangi]